MKTKKIFVLVISVVVIAVLFVGCNNDVPTAKAPDESKSFAQEKIESMGFRTAKSDSPLPTCEDLPEELQKVAADPYNLASWVNSVGVIGYSDCANLSDKLAEHPEYIAQLTILAAEAVDSAEDLNWKNIESSPAVIALDEFGKSNGLWT